MRRKYLGRTEGRKDRQIDGQTDRGKTVYPLPLRMRQILHHLSVEIKFTPYQLKSNKYMKIPSECDNVLKI